jgi:hypothetical protein
MSKLSRATALEVGASCGTRSKIVLFFDVCLLLPWDFVLIRSAYTVLGMSASSCH